MNTKEIRSNLLTRLAAAAGLLLGSGHRDSHGAVVEAADLITKTPSGSISELRAIRQWHYDQYRDLSHRASQAQRKSDSRMFNADSRNDFERVAQGFQTRANQHLRFVRSMNSFFPEHDAVI